MYDYYIHLSTLDIMHTIAAHLYQDNNIRTLANNLYGFD